MGRDTVAMAKIKFVLEGQPPHDLPGVNQIPPHTPLSSEKTKARQESGRSAHPRGLLWGEMK